jgi:hypothetical protein
MSQKYVNLLDVLPNDAAWDADWNLNVKLLTDAFRTFKILNTSRSGDTFYMEVFQQDANGNYISNEQFFLRCRTVPYSSYTPSANAALSVTSGTGTSLIQTIATNDIIVQSAGSSYGAFSAISLQIYDLFPESFSLLIGHPNNPKFANYNNQFDFADLYPILNSSGAPVLNTAGAPIYR